MTRQLIAVVSDLHCGSTMGLCPPDPIDLDDGQGYTPSKYQKWLWQCWTEFWESVERRIRAGAKFDSLVVNGDAIDGDHHDTRQIISRDVGVHIRTAVHSLEIPLALKPKKVFIIRGTKAHVGHSASAEEAIARILKAEGHPVAKDPTTGAGSFYRLTFDVEGVRLNFLHHGRAGFRPWTRHNATALLAAQIFYEYSKRKARHPDLAVRSHTHVSDDSYKAHPVRVIQTPCWQLGTQYVNERFPEELCHIGGLMVELEGGRVVDVENKTFEPEGDVVWTEEVWTEESA